MLSLTGLLLSIGCGIGYAATDYFRKAVPAACPPMVLLFYFVSGQIPILAAWLIVSGEWRMTGAYWAPGVIDLALGIIGNFLFVIAVRKSPLSLMIPLLALVPVFTAVTGAVALDEQLTARQLMGTGVVAVGILVLNMPGGGGLSIVSAWRALVREPGTLAMVGTALAWSLTPVFDKICVAASSVPVHGLVQVTLFCAFTGLWVAARSGPASLKAPPGSAAPLAGGALAAGLAYGLQLAAYTVAFVALVELIKRTTGLLSALIVGRLKFAEPITAAKVLGIALIAVGLPFVILN
ncbi:MAG: DMT family transporter [Rhodospirillaceae bacterium]|nr:DMT family transporter [Rhodospirillaceae bacterium]